MRDKQSFENNFLQKFRFSTCRVALLSLKGKKTAMEEGDSSVWIISDDESVDGKDKNTIMDIGEIEKSKRKSNKINHSNTEIIKIDGMCLKNF